MIEKILSFEQIFVLIVEREENSLKLRLNVPLWGSEKVLLRSPKNQKSWSVRWNPDGPKMPKKVLLLWYFQYSSLCFHNYWLDFFHQGIYWQLSICRRFFELIFVDFCASKRSFMVGRNCSSSCYFVIETHTFLKLSSWIFPTKSQIDNFLFSQNLCENICFVFDQSLLHCFDRKCHNATAPLVFRSRCDGLKVSPNADFDTFKMVFLSDYPCSFLQVFSESLLFAPV